MEPIKKLPTMVKDHQTSLSTARWAPPLSRATAIPFSQTESSPRNCLESRSSTALPSPAHPSCPRLCLLPRSSSSCEKTPPTSRSFKNMSNLDSSKQNQTLVVGESTSKTMKTSVESDKPKKVATGLQHQPTLIQEKHSGRDLTVTNPTTEVPDTERKQKKKNNNHETI